MSIVVKYEGQYFEAGKEVVGSILLTVDGKPIEIKCFKIDLLLKTEGRWPGGLLFDNKTGGEIKKGKQLVLDVNGTFTAGTHEIPFRYPLDSKLPASCSQKCKSGEITFSYRLKIEGVKPSTFSFNLTANVPLFVSDNKSFPVIGACMTETKKAKKYCCISKGVSSIDASVDQTDFVIGRDSVIPVTVSFKNNTQYPVDRLQVRVMYTLYMHRRSGSEEAWISAAEEVASATLPVCIKPNEYVDNLIIQCPVPSYPWRSYDSYSIKCTAALAVEAFFVNDVVKSNGVGCKITVH